MKKNWLGCLHRSQKDVNTAAQALVTLGGVTATSAQAKTSPGWRGPSSIWQGPWGGMVLLTPALVTQHEDLHLEGIPSFKAVMCVTGFNRSQQYRFFNFTLIKSLSYLKYWRCPLEKALPVKEKVHAAHLNNVENHVLVEAVQYALGHPVVAPGTVNQQELL